MLALFVALTLLAPAHSRSEGKSSFSLDETGRVAISIQLSDADLPELCNVDFTVPDRTRAEAELSRCLEQGLAGWLRLNGDGHPCPVAYLRWKPRERTITVEAEARCAALPRQLVLDWGLFAGGALDHVSVALLEQPHAKPRMVLLSKRSSRFVLEVARPWWPLAVGAGALLLLAGGAVLLLRRRRATGSGRAHG